MARDSTMMTMTTIMMTTRSDDDLDGDEADDKSVQNGPAHIQAIFRRSLVRARRRQACTNALARVRSAPRRTSRSARTAGESHRRLPIKASDSAERPLSSTAAGNLYGIAPYMFGSPDGVHLGAVRSRWLSAIS